MRLKIRESEEAERSLGVPIGGKARKLAELTRGENVIRVRFQRQNLGLWMLRDRGVQRIQQRGWRRS